MINHYPRPDFERSGLRWQSLNGPWHFLFDDDDVGLTRRWSQHGLPVELEAPSVPETSAASSDAVGPSANDSITRHIAAGTQELRRDNALTSSVAPAARRRRTIQVSFVFQSQASGINDSGLHQVIWYERALTDLRTPQDRIQGRRLLLRFGAVDYEASVWVNSRFVGGHRGGHVPFALDVTDAVDAAAPNEESRLTLRVYDATYDLTQPRGKQYWGAKPESIFYTPSAGIWQSVWLELVPPVRIADSSHGTLLRSDDILSASLRCHLFILGRRPGQPYDVQVEAALAGVVVSSSPKTALSKETDSVDLEVDMRLSQDQQSRLPRAVTKDAPLDNLRCWRRGLALWSPEHPLLYDITIRLYDAHTGALLGDVTTSTGMRSIEWLCLDQGYWPGSLMTPPRPDSLKQDIELAKRMGFNGCRKHQKVEDPLFYYWADRLGYLVWAEMANGYQYGTEYVDRFNQEWTEAVRLAINHPYVVTWTPVNESWGYPALKDFAEQQHHVRALYHLTNSRSINDNCGWEHVCTDLTTFHDYSDGPELEKTCASLDLILGPKVGRDLFVGGAQHRAGAPTMCTEFGGVNIAPASSDSERAATDGDWGYTTAADPQDLLARFERLVKAVTKGGHCCAFVYTQLTDIEQEVNGLYSFDRREKIDAGKVKAIIDEAVQAFYARVASSS